MAFFILSIELHWLLNKQNIMSRGNISMLQSNPSFTVLTGRIFARNEFSVATLIIPFKLEFSETPGRYSKMMSKAEVLFFKGELRTHSSSIYCGESTVFTNSILSAHQRSFESQFQFSFSHEITNKIEKQRTGDLPMSISVTAQTAEYEEIELGNASRSFITGFDKASGHVDFQIAQSDWVKNLLPQMGHQSFRLIELPIASQIIPGEYATSMRELEEARKYFLNGDYDKTVAHCRSALDPFKPKKDEIKKYVSSKSEFAWAKDVMEATDEWLLKLVKSTSHFTSKTHHIPSTGHFDRTEAEIIMMVTTAIIAYIGKVGG
jgi:hypothetical protein